MEKIKFGILIRGPVASGKTTLVRRLLHALGSTGWRMGIVHGDYMSLVIYGASFDDNHLSLKYDNVTALIHNICHYGYNIIIDDLVRRDKDLKRIREAVLKSAEIFVDISLDAPFKILLNRQQSRDSSDFVGLQKAKRFYRQALFVSYRPNLKLNTHRLSEQQCLDRILKFLKFHAIH